MRDFAEKFYKSKAWRTTRNGYAKSAGGLCERCLKKGIVRSGEIVHHKIELTPDNINDPRVSLAWENLELLCRECHAAAHGKKMRRYKLDALGKVSGGPPI